MREEDLIKFVTLAARNIIDETERIYDIGRRIWGEAMGAMSGASDLAHGLWLIWGSLTDLVDAPRSTATEEEANAMMRRAASEWLLVADDPAQRKEYLDRWVYDECGYERRSGDP